MEHTTTDGFADADTYIDPVLMGLVFVMAIFKSIFAMIVGILFGMVLLFIILIIPLLKWNRMELSQIFKRYE